jgi:hypothetical protein
LEYKINPIDINIELRIYQNNEVLYDIADPALIRMICDRIVEYDLLIKRIKEENHLE